MKHCWIVDYCRGNNVLHFGVDPTKSGQMAATLEFRYDILHITFVHRQLLGGIPYCIWSMSKRSKVVEYLIVSVGLGADPSLLAVSPHVT